MGKLIIITAIQKDDVNPDNWIAEKRIEKELESPYRLAEL